MKNNKGFSLVELIVVIAIMAILAAVAIPTFASFITKANVAADKDFANGIEYAVNIALAGEAKEAATVAVTWDKSDEKIVALSYTLVGDTDATTPYAVITDGAKVTDTARQEVIDAIYSIIDTDYDLKTGAKVESGIVTITVQE